MVIRRPKPRKVSPPTSAAKPKRRAGKIGDSDKSPKNSAPSALVTGNAGFKAADQQQKKQQAEYERRKETPFAFRITQAEMSKGNNSAKMLYLDETPVFVRLHTIKNARGGFDDEICIADTGEPCPLCRKLGKEGTHTLVLSALDTRSYRNREGVLIKISKKMVHVKARNIAKFERQFKKHGTFRGLVAMHRRHGNKEASIGEDIEFEDKLVSELAIKKATKNKAELMQPADYAKIFPPTSAEQLAERYGEDMPLSGGGGANDDDDDIPW